MLAQVKLLRQKRAMKVHVRFGAHGLAGAPVLLPVTVVFNLDTGLVSGVKTKTARDLLLTNNNATYNLVLSLDQ